MNDISDQDLIPDEAVQNNIIFEHWAEEDSETLDAKPVNDPNVTDLRIIRSNIDYNLDFLVQSIDKNIDLGPSFQRRSRWSLLQKSLLIESLIMNLPIPPIFLFEKEYYSYEVVDGRQRLETIKEFLGNRFKLQNLQYYTDYNGKLFNQFDLQTQRMLLRRTISATVLLAESTTYDKANIRMILFDRLNTGGTKLNAQELRNAIFSGPYNDMILELSAHSHFREIWLIPDPTKTIVVAEKEKLELALKNNPMYRSMIDSELILRFFAIREVVDSDITGSMRELLDKTMRKYINENEGEITRLKTLFTNTLIGLYKIFGKDAFKNPIAKGKARNIYDALMVGYSRINISELQTAEVIKLNLLKVLQNTDNYEKIITKGNSLENIRFRVEKAEAILTTNLS